MLQVYQCRGHGSLLPYEVDDPAEFEYDGLNRRTIKKVFGDGALDYTRHYYFSDQWQVLEERVDSAMSADRQYVWGMRYVDDLILRDHDSTRLYALSDALFNVVAITDDTGDVKERFAYQPYGESAELNADFTTYSGTDYRWEYRFTGRELDLESGLQLNRNRYLHQRLGRWVTRDELGYATGLFNLYTYGDSRAIDTLDSHGLQTSSSNAAATKPGDISWIPIVPIPIERGCQPEGATTITTFASTIRYPYLERTYTEPCPNPTNIPCPDDNTSSNIGQRTCTEHITLIISANTQVKLECRKHDVKGTEILDWHIIEIKTSKLQSTTNKIGCGECKWPKKAPGSGGSILA